MMALLSRFLKPLNLSAGALIAFGVFSAINALWWLPQARSDAEARVTSELTAQFFQAVGDLADEAEAARLRVSVCADRGLQYDPEAGDCVEA
jgi:hypothetical protein